MALKGGRAPVTGADNYTLREQLFEQRRQLQTAQKHAAPPNGVIGAYLTAAQVGSFFDATGKGKGDYAGWAICNGNNGTPLLNGKFPRFSTSAAGATGGADSSAHTHSIAHNHTNTDNHVLTTAQLPAHAHSVGVVPEYVGAGAGAYNVLTNAVPPLDWQDRNATANTGSGSPHFHTIANYTGNSGAASATDNRPAYAELVPLMRI
jgi:hypothetical protein